MSKGGGSVPSVNTSALQQQMQKANDIAQQQADLGSRIYSYGAGRTTKYADPVLDQFLQILGLGGGTAAPAAAPAASPAAVAAGATPSPIPVPSLSDITQQLTAYYGGAGGVGGTEPRTWLPQHGIDPNKLTSEMGGLPTSLEQGADSASFSDWINRAALTARGDLTAQQQPPPATPATAPGGTTQAGSPFTSILSSSMMQLPIWATQQQYDAAKKNIMNTLPPGPQQAAAIANLQNQRMQGLGTQAYGMVNNMLSSLLGQGGAWQTGAQAAQTGLSGAASTTMGAAGIAGNIAQIQQQNQQLQMMAQQQGNQMLGGIFSSIGQLAGYGLGQYAGSASGSAAITSMLAL